MQIGQTLPEAVVDIPQKPFGFRGPHTTASGNTKREPNGSLLVFIPLSCEYSHEKGERYLTRKKPRKMSEAKKTSGVLLAVGK